MPQSVMVSLNAFKLRMVILKLWKDHIDFTNVKIGKFFECYSKATKCKYVAEEWLLQDSVCQEKFKV